MININEYLINKQTKAKEVRKYTEYFVDYTSISIEEFIEKYDAFFKSAKFDIAHSSKGRWYFTEYNEEYGYYEYFICCPMMPLSLRQVFLRQQCAFSIWSPDLSFMRDI